jgi:hypothetical protein
MATRLYRKAVLDDDIKDTKHTRQIVKKQRVIMLLAKERFAKERKPTATEMARDAEKHGKFH